MAESKTTTDHDEIRNWVEERGCRPAHVAETGSSGDPGVVRIDFDEPGGDDDRLQEISCDEWFAAFEENARVPVPAGQSLQQARLAKRGLT